MLLNSKYSHLISNMRDYWYHELENIEVIDDQLRFNDNSGERVIISFKECCRNYYKSGFMNISAKDNNHIVGFRDSHNGYPCTILVSNNPVRIMFRTERSKDIPENVYLPTGPGSDFYKLRIMMLNVGYVTYDLT